MSRYIRNETVERYMDLGSTDSDVTNRVLEVNFYRDGKIILDEKYVFSVDALREMLDDYEAWAEDEEKANGTYK